METNKKIGIFTIEAIDFEHKLQNFIRRFFDALDTTKPLMFNKPFLSCIDGEMKQVDGMTIAENGRIKPIIHGWDINETPSIALLDITTLVRIADILNDWKYHFED